MVEAALARLAFTSRTDRALVVNTQKKAVQSPPGGGPQIRTRTGAADRKGRRAAHPARSVRHGEIEHKMESMDK